jgi:CheY-like chemotaxis protein
MGSLEATVERANCPCRVLLAEDDEFLALVIRDFLRDEGFEVALAVDGLEALERAKDGSFDVLLTDFRMPRMNGAELICRLRAQFPMLPVVLMSGNPPADVWSRINAAGDDTMMFVHKPMHLQHLLKALQQVRRHASGEASKHHNLSGWVF